MEDEEEEAREEVMVVEVGECCFSSSTGSEVEGDLFLRMDEAMAEDEARDIMTLRWRGRRR